MKGWVICLCFQGHFIYNHSKVASFQNELYNPSTYNGLYIKNYIPLAFIAYLMVPEPFSSSHLNHVTLDVHTGAMSKPLSSPYSIYSLHSTYPRQLIRIAYRNLSWTHRPQQHYREERHLTSNQALHPKVSRFTLGYWRCCGCLLVSLGNRISEQETCYCISTCKSIAQSSDTGRHLMQSTCYALSGASYH